MVVINPEDRSFAAGRLFQSPDLGFGRSGAAAQFFLQLLLRLAMRLGWTRMVQALMPKVMRVAWTRAANSQAAAFSARGNRQL